MAPPYFVFDRAALQDLASRSRERYAAATPFPHVVLDRMFPPEVADRLLAEYPFPDRFAAEHDAGERHRQGEVASADEAVLGPFTRHLLRHLNSPLFPEPLRCPEGTTRQSLQLYYYTNGRPPDEASPPHPTLFQWRSQNVEAQR